MTPTDALYEIHALHQEDVPMTVVVACRCRVCAVNASALGLPLPLRAEVPAALAAKCKGKAHGLVHLAHDPNAITGAAARAACGVRPLIAAASV